MDGKWQPYGGVHRTILKPVRNPIPTYAYTFSGKIPLMDIPVGFDLEHKDFVHPYGHGVRSDFCLLYKEEVKNNWTYRSTLTLLFTNGADGAYLMNMDSYSSFRTEYHANTNASYQQKFVFEKNFLDPKKRFDTSLNETQYLVLRTRTKVSKNGDILEAQYSKNHGPWG